jgi:hypothetical protein
MMKIAMYKVNIAHTDVTPVPRNFSFQAVGCFLLNATTVKRQFACYLLLVSTPAPLAFGPERRYARQLTQIRSTIS